MRSIKHGCLAHFFINRLYTRPHVEITFYHWIHNRTNGDLVHDACDPRSTSQMLAYAPHIFHKLEFIWTQLGLRYTMKNIYDKHKKIWWAWVNAGEWMTQDDFLQFQDIAYLNQKHKKGTWHFPLNHGFVLILMMFFYFQDASEVNGIHVPFTIGIQTPMQLQVMLKFGHNQLIFMDATFGTNDVKNHSFTLMVFDFHCTWVPVAWIIMSQQTCEDLVE